MSDGFVTPDEYARRLAVRKATQEQPPVLPPVQQQDLSFAYGPTPENPPISARGQYEAKLAEEPQLSEYHPSGLRKFLSVLGGIGGGLATHSLQGGVNLGEDIKYGPFKSKMNAFRQQLEQLGLKAKSEEEGKKLEAGLGETKAKTIAEQQRAEQEGATSRLRAAQTRRLQPGTPESQEAEKMQFGNINKTLLGKFHDITLSDGTKVKGAKMQVEPNTGNIVYIGPNGARYSDDVVSDAEEARERIPITAEQLYMQDNPNATPEELKTFTAGVTKAKAEATGQRQKNLAQAGEAGVRSEEIKTRTESEKGTPADIEKFLKMANEFPERAGEELKHMTPALRTYIIRNVPPEALTFIPGAAQTRITNAKTARKHAETLETMLDNPHIKSNLGPLLGRLAVARAMIGGKETDIDATDYSNTTTDEQEFLTFLVSNAIWEATSAVGTRPARQIIDAYRKYAANPSQVEGRIRGALKAQKASVDNVIGGILDESGKGVKSPFPTPEKGTRKISNIREAQ